MGCRTLGALSAERQYAISKETIEVFVPIAERLGLDIIKSEMEDICISYLEPEKTKEIKKLLSKKTKVLQKSLDGLKKRIADVLFQKDIPFEISSRVKSINSIYRKMYIKGHPFDEIYDILALRIITETEMQCYEILGLIHQMYKPVPGRFKEEKMSEHQYVDMVGTLRVSTFYNKTTVEFLISDIFDSK